MTQYFIFIDNEQRGPFTFEELSSKKITKETKVWFEGLEEWKNAGEIQELSKIIIPTPPPINSSFSKPPTPNFQKIENDMIISDHSVTKIFGLKRNVFYTILGAVVILVALVSFNNIQENDRLELERQNRQTEIFNQQQKEIEEQKARLAEQEKIEAERIAKEKKQAINNRIAEIRDSIDINSQNLEDAKRKLNDVTGFKLLRTSSERNEQISLAQSYVDYYKNEIQKLQAEFEKINPNK